MNPQRHDVERQGSDLREYTHRPRPYWKRAHRDWRVWTVAAILLALMIVVVLTDSLFFGPGSGVTQPVPATNAP